MRPQVLRQHLSTTVTKSFNSSASLPSPVATGSRNATPLSQSPTSPLSDIPPTPTTSSSYVLFTGRAKVTPPKTITVNNASSDGVHFTSLPPPYMYDGRSWTHVKPANVNATNEDAIASFASQHLAIFGEYTVYTTYAPFSSGHAA